MCWLLIGRPWERERISQHCSLVVRRVGSWQTLWPRVRPRKFLSGYPRKYMFSCPHVSTCQWTRFTRNFFNELIIFNFLIFFWFFLVYIKFCFYTIPIKNSDLFWSPACSPCLNIHCDTQSGKGTNDQLLFAGKIIYFREAYSAKPKNGCEYLIWP